MSWVSRADSMITCEFTRETILAEHMLLLFIGKMLKNPIGFESLPLEHRTWKIVIGHTTRLNPMKHQGYPSRYIHP